MAMTDRDAMLKQFSAGLGKAQDDLLDKVNSRVQRASAPNSPLTSPVTDSLSPPDLAPKSTVSSGGGKTVVQDSESESESEETAVKTASSGNITSPTVSGRPASVTTSLPMISYADALKKTTTPSKQPADVRESSSGAKGISILAPLDTSGKAVVSGAGSAGGRAAASTAGTDTGTTTKPVTTTTTTPKSTTTTTTPKSTTTTTPKPVTKPLVTQNVVDDTSPLDLSESEVDSAESEEEEEEEGVVPLVDAKWAKETRERTAQASEWLDYWKWFGEACTSWQESTVGLARKAWKKELDHTVSDVEASLAGHTAAMALARAERARVARALETLQTSFGKDSSRDLATLMGSVKREMVLFGKLTDQHCVMLRELVTYLFQQTNAIKTYADNQVVLLRKVWNDANKLLLDIHDIGAAKDQQAVSLAALRSETEYKIQLGRYEHEAECAALLLKQLDKCKETADWTVTASVQVVEQYVKEVEAAMHAAGTPAGDQGKALLTPYVRSEKELKTQLKYNGESMKKLRRQTNAVRARIYRVFTAWRQHPKNTAGNMLHALVDFYAKCVEEAAVMRMENRLVQMVAVLARRFPNYFTDATGFKNRVLLNEPACLTQPLRNLVNEPGSVPRSGKWRTGVSLANARLYNTARAWGMRDAVRHLEDGSGREPISVYMRVNDERPVFDKPARVGLSLQTVGGGYSTCAVYPTWTLINMHQWLQLRGQMLQDEARSGNLAPNVPKLNHGKLLRAWRTVESSLKNPVEAPVVMMHDGAKAPTLDELVGAVCLVDVSKLRPQDEEWYGHVLDRYMTRVTCLVVLSEQLKQRSRTHAALTGLAVATYNAFIAAVFLINSGSWTFMLLQAAWEAEAARIGRRGSLDSVLQAYVREGLSNKTDLVMVDCIAQRDTVLSWPNLNDDQQEEAAGFTMMSTWIKTGKVAKAYSQVNHDCPVPITQDQCPVFKWSPVAAMPLVDGYHDAEGDTVNAVEDGARELQTVIARWALQGADGRGAQTIEQDQKLMDMIQGILEEDGEGEELDEDSERMIANWLQEEETQTQADKGKDEEEEDEEEELPPPTQLVQVRDPDLSQDSAVAKDEIPPGGKLLLSSSTPGFTGFGGFSSFDFPKSEKPSFTFERSSFSTLTDKPMFRSTGFTFAWDQEARNRKALEEERDRTMATMLRRSIKASEQRRSLSQSPVMESDDMVSDEGAFGGLSGLPTLSRSSPSVDILHSYYVKGPVGASVAAYLKRRSDVDQGEIMDHMNEIYHMKGRSNPDDMFASKEVADKLGFIEQFWSRMEHVHPLSVEDTENLTLDTIAYVSKLGRLALDLDQERDAELNELEDA